jgi:hypothetical protein
MAGLPAPQSFLAGSSGSDATMPDPRSFTAGPKPLAALPDPRTFSVPGPSPTPPADIASLEQAAAKKHGIDPALFSALIQTESGNNPKAVSDAGAQGLGQIMPFNDKGLGLTKPFDPGANLDASASMLASALAANKGNVDLALAAYNAGQGAVDKYGGIPPFPETQAYVKKVRALLPPQFSLPAPVAPSISGAAFGMPSADITPTVVPESPTHQEAVRRAQARVQEAKTAQQPQATIGPYENEEALKKIGDALEVIPEALWTAGLSDEDRDTLNQMRGQAVQMLTPGKNWNPELAFKTLEGMRNLYGTGSRPLEERYAAQHSNDIAGISAQEAMDNPVYNALGTLLLEWYNPSNKGLQALNVLGDLSKGAYAASKLHIPAWAQAVQPIEDAINAAATHYGQAAKTIAAPIRSLFDRYHLLRDIAGEEGEAWQQGMTAVDRESKERAVEQGAGDFAKPVGAGEARGATPAEQMRIVRSYTDRPPQAPPPSGAPPPGESPPEPQGPSGGTRVTVNGEDRPDLAAKLENEIKAATVRPGSLKNVTQPSEMQVPDVGSVPAVPSEDDGWFRNNAGKSPDANPIDDEQDEYFRQAWGDERADWINRVVARVPQLRADPNVERQVRTVLGSIAIDRAMNPNSYWNLHRLGMTLESQLYGSASTWDKASRLTTAVTKSILEEGMPQARIPSAVAPELRGGEEESELPAGDRSDRAFGAMADDRYEELQSKEHLTPDEQRELDEEHERQNRENRALATLERSARHERGFAQIPGTERTPLSPEEIAARGRAVQASTIAARDEVLRVDPRNAQRLFGGIQNDDWFSQKEMWGDKGAGQAKKLPAAERPGVGGGRPMGAKGREYENVGAGLAAGETIDPEFIAAKNHIDNLYQKYGYVAAADQIRKLQNIRDINGVPLMSQLDFKFQFDPNASKIDDVFKRPAPTQTITSWGTGPVGMRVAQRRVNALAWDRSLSRAYHKLGRNATLDAAKSLAKQYHAQTAERMMDSLMDAVTPDNHVWNADKSMNLPYLNGYSIHRNAATAIVDALPQLQNDLVSKIGRWLEQEHSGGAGVAASIANGVMRVVDNVNTLARQAMIVNPIFHPVWNLSIQALSKGLPIDKLIEAWNVDLGGPQGILRASQLDPKWESLAKEWHTDVFMGGQPYQMDPHTQARLLTVPREQLPIHEQIAQGAMNLSRTNQRFVFATMEHRIGTLLFQYLVEDQKMSFAAAARAVRQTLGDYGNITKFERGLSRAFFFYPWLKTVMAYWARKGIKDPQWWNAPMQAAYASRQSEQIPEPGNPMAFGLGRNDQGTPRYMSLPTPQRYMRDIANLTAGAFIEPGGLKTPIQTGMEMAQTHANPMLELPVGLATSVFPGTDPQEPEPWNNVLFDPRANLPTQVGQIGSTMLGRYMYPGRIGRTARTEGVGAAAESLLGPSIYSEPTQGQRNALDRIQTMSRGRPGESGYQPSVNEQIRVDRQQGRDAAADALLQRLYQILARYGY